MFVLYVRVHRGVLPKVAGNAKADVIPGLTEFIVSVVTESVSSVPFDTIVMVRALVNTAVFSSVPPLNVSPPDGSPRLLSLEICRIPFVNVHGVTAVVVLVSVQVLVPVFSTRLKFWCCAVLPINDTSSETFALPPRINALLVDAALASTLPTIADPTSSSSVSCRLPRQQSGSHRIVRCQPGSCPC
jgi:hypothetical protein